MKVDIQKIKVIPEFKRRGKAKDVSKQGDEFLLESLKNVGLNEPFTVMKQGDTFILVDGYRRLKAIKDLYEINELHDSIDVNALPAVEIKNISPVVARVASEIRQDLKPTERAFYIDKLLKEHSMSRKDIANMFGWSTPSVANWLVILYCIRPVQNGIDEGRFPMSAGKIFSVMTEQGQKKLFRKFSGMRRIKRSTLQTQAAKITHKYFKRPYEERMEISESVRKAKKGYKHKDRTILKIREKEKGLLSDDISTKEKELTLLKRDRNDFSRRVRKYAYEVETWLRTPKIKNFIKEKYPKIFENLRLIIDIELGIQIEK